MVTLNLFKDIRHFTEGDFYALTEYSLSRETWFAMQFHRPDLDQGLLAVFRRPDSPYIHATFALRALAPDRNYRFVSVFGDVEFAGKGSNLREGLEVSLPQAPDVLLFNYAKED